MLKKEQIKDRMLKTAARLWEVPEGEIESNFDPLVMLLLETCAGELEHIGAGIHTAQDRLLDKLAELMLPEAMINARPASCILYAPPSELAVTVDEQTRFYTTQRIQQAGAAPYNRDFYFTPAGRFPLLKATLACMKAGNRYFRFTAGGQKELLFDTGRAGASGELWLAIAPDKQLGNLKGLSLFFDLKGHSEAQRFYRSLAHTRAWVNGREIRLAPGYNMEEQFELHPEEALNGGINYTRKVHRQVAGIYRDRFLHIAGDCAADGSLPGDWTELPEKIRQGMAAEGMTFIRLELDRQFPQETLDRLACSINAFPAVNRNMHTMNYRTDAWVNIIPMQTEDTFLDLQSISGASGTKYKINVSAATRQPGEGEAIVRSSGVGKTSSRDLREIIGSLTEAIRDESAYFSRMSNDFVLARLREITRILARLEDQMQVARDRKDSMHYLLLKPASAGETISLSYWTTAGPDAHTVKAGTALTAFNHSLCQPKGTCTLTNASGGKSMISASEKQYMLKRQLSSGGKIVSAEDVKLLCYQLFGAQLKKVAVKKGVHPGEGPREGFVRTIDIFLTLDRSKAEAANDEQAYLCGELEYSLSRHASPVYPFRVVIQ